MQQRSRQRADADTPARTKQSELPQSPESSQRSDDLVARRAYERYEARGREDGHDMEDWLEAEREVSRSSSGGDTRAD